MFSDLFSQLTRHRLFKKVFGLTILLYLSPIVGVLVDVMFIRRFGAGEVMDLYRVLMGFIILGNGLLSAQLFKFIVIPKLAAYKADGRDAEGLLFARRFVMVIFALISPILAIGFIAPAEMLHFLAPGLSEGITDQGLLVTRIATFGFAMTTLVGAFSAVLNFYGNFWGQPLGQVLLNASMLIGLLIFGHWAHTQSAQIVVVEYALLVGVLLMGGISLFLYYGVQKRVGQVANQQTFLSSLIVIVPLLLPQLILLASEMYKPILMNQTLSYAGAGAVALYQLAYRLLMLGGLPVQGLLTVLFPDMANKSVVNSAAVQFRSYLKTAALLFTGTVLISVVLWLLADIIIGLLSFVSDMEAMNRDMLLDIYRALLVFAPFGAIGIYAVQSAYSYNLRLLVIGYSLVTVGLLFYFLPDGVGADIGNIIRVFVVVQSGTYFLMNVVMLFILYRKTLSY